MDKIEMPEEFAQKVKDYCFDAWTMNREQGQYMGEFDLDEATRLITDFTALLRADERQKAAGWISVKDRLPEDGQRVLVLIYGFYCPTPYTADFVKRSTGGVFIPVYDEIVSEHPMSRYSISMAEFDIQPSYWMPPPEPPAIMSEPEEAQG